MKEQFLYLLLLILMMPIMVKAQNQTLVLWHANGSTTDVDLYTEPKVTFTDTKLLINSTILDMEYAAEDIVRFTYKSKGAGIDDLQENIDYSEQDGCLIFHNISSAGCVAVFRIDGICIPVHLTVEGGDVVLSLSTLSRGVYIIRINGRSSKFILK